MFPVSVLTWITIIKVHHVFLLRFVKVHSQRDVFPSCSAIRPCLLSNIDNEHRARRSDAPCFGGFDGAGGVGVSSVDLIGQAILMNGFNGLK